MDGYVPAAALPVTTGYSFIRVQWTPGLPVNSSHGHVVCRHTVSKLVTGQLVTYASRHTVNSAHNKATSRNFFICTPVR